MPRWPRRSSRLLVMSSLFAAALFVRPVSGIVALTRDASSQAWEQCAEEGQLLPRARLSGPVRFGFGESWRHAGSLRQGARCAAEAFGGDPLPGVRKVCLCYQQPVAHVAVDSTERLRNELGLDWSFCAQEDDDCACSTAVRFGFGSRWVVQDMRDRRPLGPSRTPAVRCSASALGAGDPAPFRRKQCWCEVSPPPAPAALVASPASSSRRQAVAIVLLTRRPADLRTWLQYHIAYMRIDHVFMRVEDTPGFEDVWRSIPSALQQRVTLWQEADAPAVGALEASSRRPKDDYETLQARQLKYMGLAKQQSAAMGIDWLLHIDDDELLYTPMHRDVGELLANMPQDIDQAYVPNIEAVYPSAEVASCFRETSFLNMNRYAFQAYANGKAAVRVAADALPAGPHSWRTSDDMEPPSLRLDTQPFGSPLLLVHFESCPFSRWENKFWELGDTSPEKVASIPFPFYRKSIQLMQACAAGARNASDVAVMAAQDCDTPALKAFWAQWKTQLNTNIKQEDLMPLRIEWPRVDSAIVAQDAVV
eukprot:TRINITY_DN24312_c0_g1_i2.p1 TRINITY_DN24312_c0_g1~~TRINITY_DN24312_c0_g1_i2.p1  ORF type:complete len:536 (+),score=117.22 TRINITY_DN24312_c0_g1_i2:85-1692(+)